MAYQEEAPVNWCPELKAVLSHEEVADGVSVEGEHPVYQKNLRQWKLKITAYAEALLKDLEELDWPEPIKEQQRNWIGKSQGVTAKFYLQQNPDLFFDKLDVLLLQKLHRLLLRETRRLLILDTNSRSFFLISQSFFKKF